MIADKPNHLKFNETLLWLAKLATQLPEPADIIERVGKYNDDAGRALQQPAAEAISTGSSTTCSAGTSTATANTKRRSACSRRSTRRASTTSSRSSSRGICYVQLRKSVPAVKSFQRIVDRRSTKASKASRTRRACATSRTSRWRAPTTRRRSRSTTNNAPTIDSDEALGRGQVLEPGRRRERVLARRALRGVVGVLHGRRLPARARQHPHDRGAVLPELVLPGSGHPQGGHLLLELPTTTTRPRSSRGSRRSTSRSRRSSRRCSTSFKGEGSEQQFFKFLKDVRDGKANLDADDQAASSRTRSAIASSSATSSTCAARRGGGALQEGAGELPELARSAATCSDALKLARDLAVRNAGKLARERYQRNLDELNEHLRNASEDPHRHHRRRAKPARREDRQRAGQQGRIEDLRRREAGRRARALAVRRRVLARRARLLPPGRRVRSAGGDEDEVASKRALPLAGRSFGLALCASLTGVAMRSRTCELARRRPRRSAATLVASECDLGRTAADVCIAAGQGCAGACPTASSTIARQEAAAAFKSAPPPDREEGATGRLEAAEPRRSR